MTLCPNSNISVVIQVENPLGEAMKYLKLLQDHSGDSLETHLLAFEVFFRKQKHLLALQVQNVSSKGWNLASEQGQLSDLFCPSNLSKEGSCFELMSGFGFL